MGKTGRGKPKQSVVEGTSLPKVAEAIEAESKAAVKSETGLKRRRPSAAEVPESSDSEDGSSQDEDPFTALTAEAVNKHQKLHEGSVQTQQINLKDWAQETAPITNMLASVVIDLEKKRRQEVIDFENKRRADSTKLNNQIEALFKQVRKIANVKPDQSPRHEAATCSDPVDFMANQLIDMLDEYETVNKRDREKDAVVEVFQQVVLRASRHMIDKHMSESEKHKTGMIILSAFTSDMHHSTPSSGKK